MTGYRKSVESKRDESLHGTGSLEEGVCNIDPQEICERSPLLPVPLVVGMTTGGREYGTPYRQWAEPLTEELIEIQSRVSSALHSGLRRRRSEGTGARGGQAVSRDPESPSLDITERRMDSQSDPSQHSLEYSETSGKADSRSPRLGPAPKTSR